MKKNLLKLYIFTTVMFSDFMMFAQLPGDDDPGGGLEGDDPPPAPINGKLIWLAVAGILFAIYMYRNSRKEKQA